MKMKRVFKRIGYLVKDKPQGFSAYHKVLEVTITLNVVVKSLKFQEREVTHSVRAKFVLLDRKKFIFELIQ